MEGYQNDERYQNDEGYRQNEGCQNRDGYQNSEEAGFQQPAGYYSYGEADGVYRSYEAEQNEPPKRRRPFAGKFIKLAALGLSFGVIAATAFAGTNYFFASVTDQDTPAADAQDKLSGGDLNIAEAATESIDRISQRPEGTDTTSAGAATDVSGIVEEAVPSIVSITTIARTQMPGFFFGEMQEYENEGCGSGIIVSQDEENLYVATNNHVVERAQTLTVLFSDGKSVSAQIKGTDASSDLAVVSIALADIEEDTKKEIRTAVFGDSSALSTGQMAIAIGNALGYGQSVTTGVISALDREVTVTNEDGSTVTNELLQTDAAINPGNSGGALLNAQGEVIGINSVKYSETSVEGMGYAIPSKTAIPIIRQLITREVVTGSETAYLGISGVDVTQSVSESYNMPQGVYVAQVVEGSGAANAGLMQGDIITGFDGRNIKSMDEMQELMKYLPAGSSVEVTIERAQNGEYVEQTLEIVLGAKK